MAAWLLSAVPMRLERMCPRSLCQSRLTVVSGTKAFIASFAAALRNELKDTGVSVTCLMPGATETAFFERAGMADTKVGASESKDDPADVAALGFDAMEHGDGDVVAGW